MVITNIAIYCFYISFSQISSTSHIMEKDMGQLSVSSHGRLTLRKTEGDRELTPVSLIPVIDRTFIRLHPRRGTERPQRSPALR